LHYAHRKDYTLYGKVYHGLIHRDIKPDNLVISKEGVVKLMDFGVARPSEVSLHTVGSKIVGTLVYLSPEQLNGTQLDHRTDLFSLGCVLYEMITGTRAFPHQSLQELVQKKMKGAYEPITVHGMDLPTSIVTIIDKSLALNPDSRFASAAEFGEAVFSALHEITDRAPGDILYRFMTNPAAVGSTTVTRRREIAPENARKPISPLWWIVGAGVGIAAVIGTLAAVLSR
jgi:serine/threonine protein kinase